MPFKPQINEHSNEIVKSRLIEHQKQDTEKLPQQGGENVTSRRRRAKAVPGHPLHPTTDATKEVLKDQEIGKHEAGKDLIQGRAGWVTQHLVNNYKTNKSAGTHYHHDAKRTTVGDYFSQSCFDRLSAK